MKKIFSTIGLVVLILLSIILFRTILFKSRQVQAEPIAAVAVDSAAVEHLSKAIQLRTISFQDPSQVTTDDFSKFHQYLEEAFPTVHTTVLKEIVNSRSLLFTWKGTDPSLKPVLLMSHMDVVPVEAGTESSWKYPAFSGSIAEGYIWGRGALDDKVGVTGILEAAEMLARSRYRPKRSLYLAFGHDEELGGPEGARKIGALLQTRKVAFEFILDEGLAITEGIFPGMTLPVAMLGVAEKGYVSLELMATAEGGHSSMPPKETAIGILSAAIKNLEEHPFPPRLASPAREMFEFVGSEMQPRYKVVVANLWLFGGLLKRRLASEPASNALIRTTVAPTIVQAGTKENVLPASARAVINFRILSGDSIRKVENHARDVIEDKRIKIRILNPSQEPSAVSDPKSPNFHLVQTTIRQVFPRVLTTPALVVGGTDTKHYKELSSDIYRFTPMRLGPEDLSRIHGTNERIAVEDYKNCVRFYYQLLRNATSS